MFHFVGWFAIWITQNFNIHTRAPTNSIISLGFWCGEKKTETNLISVVSQLKSIWQAALIFSATAQAMENFPSIPFFRPSILASSLSFPSFKFSKSKKVRHDSWNTHTHTNKTPIRVDAINQRKSGCKVGCRIKEIWNIMVPLPRATIFWGKRKASNRGTWFELLTFSRIFI